MADHIDLTKDSDDEGQSTFESDAALARRLSAELNGEAPKNNKRTIDLTADSQEDAAPPPAQRARTSQEYSTTAPAKSEGAAPARGRETGTAREQETRPKRAYDCGRPSAASCWMNTPRRLGRSKLFLWNCDPRKLGRC